MGNVGKNCHTMNNAYFYLSGLTDLTVENNVFSGYGTFVNGVNGATIRDNVFENTRGLEFTAAWGPTQNYNVLVEENTFQNIDGDAIKIHRYTASTPDSDFLDVHCNNFIDIEGFAVNNTFDTFTVHAENNWWGDASGPTHAGNPGGSGDTVSDNVDYDPWLLMEFQYCPECGISVISVEKTANPTSGAPCTDVTFTITVTAGEYPLDPVEVVDTLPTGMSYVSSTPEADTHDGTITWDSVGPLDPQASATITLVAHIDEAASGTLTDSVTATGTLPTGADVTDSATATVVVNLPPPPVGAVGGEAYPINKLAILVPWLALLAAIIGGATILVRRRRAQS